MKQRKMKVGLAVVIAGVLGTAAVAVASDRSDSEHLTGYQEVPALSTPGTGDFKITVNRARDELRYRLTYGGLESSALQAHIHFENATNSGPVVVFLCSNLGNGPVGTQACPLAGGTITGTIRAADIGAGAAAFGLGAGEFDEFLRALESGTTYANVHTTTRPSGEIRAQIGAGDDHGGHGNQR
jgi:hypothetical protein